MANVVKQHARLLVLGEQPQTIEAGVSISELLAGRPLQAIVNGVPVEADYIVRPNDAIILTPNISLA